MSNNDLLQKTSNLFINGRNKAILRPRTQTEAPATIGAAVRPQPNYPGTDSTSEASRAEVQQPKRNFLMIPGNKGPQLDNFHLSTCSLAVNLPSVSGDSGRNIDDHSTADNLSIVSFPTDYLTGVNEPGCSCCAPEDQNYITEGLNQHTITQRRYNSLIDLEVKPCGTTPSEKCPIHSQVRPVDLTLNEVDSPNEKLHKSHSQSDIRKVNCNKSGSDPQFTETFSPNAIDQNVSSSNSDGELDQELNRLEDGTEESVAEKCKHWLKIGCTSLGISS